MRESDPARERKIKCLFIIFFNIFVLLNDYQASHTHLVNIIEPGDRVLVIFGAGHLGLLRQAVRAGPTLTLRTIEEFASSTKQKKLLSTAGPEERRL